MTPTVNKSYVKYWLAILLMILSCGTVCFYMFNAGITLIFLLVISVIVALTSKFRFQTNAFVTTYAILIVINATFYGVNFVLIGDAVFLIATLLSLNSMNYNCFRRLFLDIMCVLIAISLFFYGLFLLGVITPNLQGVGKNDLLGYYIYAFHVFGGGHLPNMHNHLCGLFWEPGIYQMVLNITLLINLDLFDSHTPVIWRKTKLGIIVLAIILTQSTTGYLVLGLIFVGVYLKRAEHSVKFKLASVAVIAIFCCVIVLCPVIVDKFSSENLSYLVRMNDFIGLSQSMMVNPLFGLGVGSKVFDSVAFSNGMTTALSAGILLQATQFGLLWLITFYFSAYKEYGQRRIKLPIYIYIGILTALGLCEPLAYSSVMLLNVLPFKSYS